MQIAVKERLERLHEDAGCCAEDFQKTHQQITESKDFLSSLSLLESLADETRLAIFKLVQKYGKLCVCEFECVLQLSHSTVVHHLNQLVKAGVLEIEPQGKWSFYKISQTFPTRFESLLGSLVKLPEQPPRCCCSGFIPIRKERD